MKFPDNLINLLDLDAAEKIEIGKSKSDVFRVPGRKGENFYLKISDSAYVAREIDQEIKVLRWLQERHVSVPNPLFCEWHEGQMFFLMTEVSGLSLAEVADRVGAQECMHLAASFLRNLHTLDTSTCPFDRKLKNTLSFALKNLDAGLVDETDFDSDHLEKSARSLYKELLVELPQEDLVFTHGDYCFPNIIYKDSQISGVVDLGRAGVADRYQDIGIFLRSFKKNIGEPDISLFLNEYGLIKKLDLSKANFYRKLDEFF